MARRVRDSNLESRAARARLKESTKPYYRSLAPGVHLGYRKGKRERKWVMRRTNGDGSYSVTNIAASDDVVDADGKWVLDFWQAQERVRKVALAPAAVAPTSYTVKAAIDDIWSSSKAGRRPMTRVYDSRLMPRPRSVASAWPRSRPTR
jgi:hypothetical protein